MNLQTSAQIRQHYLQQSAKDFYATVEEIINEQMRADLNCKRVSFCDGELFSNRQYLCISSNGYRFYLCATPCGLNILVSWWLKERVNTVTAIFEDIPLIGEYLIRKRTRKDYPADLAVIFKENIQDMVNTAIGAIFARHGIRATLHQYSDPS